MNDFETAFKTWIRVSLKSFIDDNPDTDFQRGYLSAQLDMGTECGIKHESVWVEANRVLERTKDKA